MGKHVCGSILLDNVAIWSPCVSTRPSPRQVYSLHVSFGHDASCVPATTLHSRTRIRILFGSTPALLPCGGVSRVLPWHASCLKATDGRRTQGRVGARGTAPTAACADAFNNTRARLHPLPARRSPYSRARPEIRHHPFGGGNMLLRAQEPI